MKLSTDTLNILKNFSNINNGLYFKAGSKISTMSPSKTILAQATVAESFPKDFGIYDLNEFLGILTLLKETPEVDFDASHVIVKFLNGRSKTSYRVTDKSMIVTPPDRTINMPDVHTSFTLTEEDQAVITRFTSGLSSPNIGVVGADGVLKLITYDMSNDSVSTQELILGDTDKTFRFVFKTENLRLIPGTYVVEIGSNGISHFVNKSGNVEYWITTEKDGNKI